MLPMGLQELFLGGWLIAKGMDLDSFKYLDWPAEPCKRFEIS